MNSRLRNMLVAVGTFVLGGIGFAVYTPQPSDRTMLELRDAGIADGQKGVMVCPERMTKRTQNRIDRLQPGVRRPRQAYGYVARVVVCFNPDGGNCWRPSDGRINVADAEGEIISPSLRQNITQPDVADDGGEDGVDDSLQYRNDSCELLTCGQAATEETAGTFNNPYATPFCGGLNRVALQPSPCMIPDGSGRGADGGWCEESECIDTSSPTGYRPCGPGDTCGQVNCLRADVPFGGVWDGGSYRWGGFNVIPRGEAKGAVCLPVECSVVAGDVPSEWL